MSFVLKQNVHSFLGADRKRTLRRASSEYKNGNSNVYMRELPPLLSIRAH